MLAFSSFLLVSSFIFASRASYIDDGLAIELRHALDPANPDKFTFRGNVTISILNVGSSSAVQEPLEASERLLLKKLAEENKFYRLQAFVLYEDGSRSKLLTSTKACALANSALADNLWISLDNTGSVLAVTQSVTGDKNCQDFRLSEDDLEHFTTEVFVREMEMAPIPDTTTFIQKMEREREARERGEVRDTRGFFAKYWMYIIPVVLLVLISGATNPER